MKKTNLYGAIVVFFITIGLIFFISRCTSAENLMVVGTENLNIRQKPTTDSPVVKRIKFLEPVGIQKVVKGQMVLLPDPYSYSTKNWCKVTYYDKSTGKNIKGYVVGAYLREFEMPKYCYLTKATTLRTKPDANGKKVMSIPKGAKVRYYDHNGLYVYVTYKKGMYSYEGWVVGTYLNRKK